MNTKKTAVIEYASFDVIGRINQLLDERGWSQNQLAKYSGITQSTISSWYNKNQIPTVPTIERACKAFGITLTEFFTTDEDETFTLTEKQKNLLLTSSKLTNEQFDSLISLVTSM